MNKSEIIKTSNLLVDQIRKFWNSSENNDESVDFIIKVKEYISNEWFLDDERDALQLFKDDLQKAIDERGKNHIEVYYDEEDDYYAGRFYEAGYGASELMTDHYFPAEIERDAVIELANELGIAHCGF